MKPRSAGITRWRRVAAATLASMVETRVGPRQSESDQARLSTNDVAVFSVAVAALYLAFSVTRDEDWFRSLMPVVAVYLAAQLGAVVLARMGYQFVAAIVNIMGTILGIVLAVALLGWQSGFHLYLIASGLLVFVVFTGAQSVFRWIFIGVATSAFIACQTVIGPFGSGPLPASTAEFMFSVNAVLTALLVFGLAGLSHNRINRARAELARQAKRAEYLANTDVLTGLSNRRPLIESLEARGHEGDYVVAIADMDHFKELNDTFGHQCGDLVLAEVAGGFTDRLRATDAVGRWGGEEFIVVLPHTSLEEGVALMERLREDVAKTVVPCAGHDHRVTISIGVADGTDDGLPHHVVKRADDALYDAKVAGRDTVRTRGLAEPLPTESHQENPRASRIRRS